MREVRVGRFALSKVVEFADARFPADHLYPDSTPDRVRAQQAELGPRFIDPVSLDLLLSFHCFVVRTGSRTILVDSCVGNDKNRPLRPAWHQRKGPFLDELQRIGVATESVDFVLCTHLHADHVGWNTRLIGGNWVPTFPNAQYLIAETEYAFWRRQHEADPAVAHGAFEDSVLPVVARGQAVMVGADHVVEPGIHLEGAPGHTPGNVVIHLEDAGARAILVGDVLHHPIQLAHPEWSTRFCSDPALSRRTRQDLLRRYADTGTRLLTGHFPSPTFGCVLRAGTAYRFAFDEA